MVATRVNAPKGPALLAKAGVSLDDAQWLYAQKRTTTAGKSVSVTDPRMQAIKAKVSAFLRQQLAIAEVDPAFA